MTDLEKLRAAIEESRAADGRPVKVVGIPIWEIDELLAEIVVYDSDDEIDLDSEPGWALLKLQGIDQSWRLIIAEKDEDLLF